MDTEMNMYILEHYTVAVVIPMARRYTIHNISMHCYVGLRVVSGF